MQKELKDIAIENFIKEMILSSEQFEGWWSIQTSEERNKFIDKLKWYMVQGDYLENIFKKQKKLDDFIVKNKAKWIPDFKDKVVAMIVEAVEVLGNTNFKWWSNKNNFNRYHFIEESADVLHFLVSPLIDAGFTAKDFYEYYDDKNNINFKRATGDY